MASVRQPDSDLDDAAGDASEDEVLAPRVEPSLPGDNPQPTRRRGGTSATGGLLMGSVLGILAVGLAGLAAIVLIAWIALG